MGDCPKLLNLILKEREWQNEVPEDKELELRLGPPGEHRQTLKLNSMNKPEETNHSLLSLRCFFSLASHKNISNTCGAKRVFQEIEAKKGKDDSLTNNRENPIQNQQHHLLKSSISKHSSNAKVAGFNFAEKRDCSGPAKPSISVDAAAANSSQKRAAVAPVVGWPPIRSFRKNISSNNSSSKLAYESPEKTQELVGFGKSENHSDALFVKINMDGVAIGRKVDLKAYKTYEELSSAVDDLFRHLLAAQTNGNKIKMEEEKAITGLLDGNGEYTLVYEDNEGDRMLVGDVPWHMFESTAKRLRVLKQSELSALCSKFLISYLNSHCG
ncbi:AUX/IAA domain [Dillenia turbinata]|uniref:Auxin-responsive protein n=1 Tax=Dillenia turbinata TaxID=194707 RepID=A0AAN8UKC2_9MAGN